MRERPILFSAQMVRSILTGNKTQTRRVVKLQPWEEYSAESIKCEHYQPCIVDKTGEIDAGPEIFGAYSTDGEWGVKCPYGQPGDWLWVRETWVPFYLDGTGHYREMRYHTEANAARYAATPEICIAYPRNYAIKWQQEVPEWLDNRWRPSIHMPRWASRITLGVTGVRVERLHAISEADAQREGVQHTIEDMRLTAGLRPYSSAFARLWKSINGADSWAANPWVWVIEFQRSN